jgi:hypothetical protein|tara:strand:+ start:25742 stop:26464 length:723 start_codon:yes stop_codon:yes gene_type:complete
LQQKSPQRKHNGFIIIASQFYEYYEAAHMLIDSLLDYMPEANIALFAHDEWTKDDPRCEDLYMVHNVLSHTRAKLWALSKTPFDKTVYLDADTCVMHEDVSKMFDFDSDLIFTNIRPYAGKIAKFIGGEMVLHGGVFGYQSTPKVLKFMDRWWELYHKQRKGTWWPGVEPKERLVTWDQLTLWWLTENEYSDLNINIYEDDARFNFVHLYKEDECEGEIVIWHYTLPLKDPIDARSILKK